jgi:glycosyltransferase involved in cell wall biosynthesis
MKSKIPLSIIIPVYNMEDYIERCLLSLLEQDIEAEDFEIIVVNDGSTDKSKELIIQLQRKFKNLILINQENRGVSAARNAGISIAKGKYLLFIDADDYVVPNALSRFIDKATRESLDVLCLNLSVYDNKGICLGRSDYGNFTGKILGGIETYRITRGKNEKEPDRSWGILFNKEFLERSNLAFLQGVPYLEDGLFVGKALCLAKRCSFDNNPFYYRIITPGSASNSDLYKTDRAREGFLKAALDLREFRNTSELNTIQQGLVNHLTAKYILSIIISAIGSRDIKKLLSIRVQISQHGFLRLKTKGLLSNTDYAILYNCSFWIFIVYYFLETRVKLLNQIIHKSLQ